MNNLGEFTIWLGLIAISISSVCFWALTAGKEYKLTWKIARYSFTAFTAFITLASMFLMLAILKHEFFYSYVAQYSSRDLPLHYLISSFWAGQEGSFLLWLLFAAWLGIFLMHLAGEMEPQVMFIYNLNNLFLTILLIKQSPFKTLAVPPPDGQGLNMLLQDPWMVIHPPVVFLGYAAYTIPFAYAVAGLWRREYNNWIRPALPWTVFAFLSLGAGIIIGGYWSYKVLGWGGYWGWDPVENASLLPWLAGTALMHGMILQLSRGKLRKTNFVLAGFSFLLVIYCTFLTRSGILADFSVHSFTDLGITGWLVLFMFAFLAIALWFFVTRLREISAAKTKKETGFSYFSREFGLVAAMIILCLSALVTGLGTSAPLITRVLEKASKVSNEFYVDTNLPLALLMVLLLSFVPLLAWGKNSFSNLSRKLIWALAGAVISGAITLYYGYPGMAVLLLSTLAGAAVGMNLHLAAKLVRKKITLSAGAVAHLGVGLMFVGIVASSVYDRSEKVLLPQGTVKPTLGYQMKFNGPQFSREPKGVRLDLPLDVTKGDAEFVAQPDIRSETRSDGQGRRFSRPHIRRGLVSDLYISPVDFQPAREESHSEKQLQLKKQEKIKFEDYDISFVGFEVSGMTDQTESRGVSVGADIVVSYKGEDPVNLKPVLDMVHGNNTSKPVRLPGPMEAYISLVQINANTKSIVLDYHGPASTPGNTAERTPPAFIAEVSIKPGMTVLWLGAFLILLGGGIGVARRWPK